MTVELESASLMRGYVEPDATKQKFLKTVRMHVGVCFVQPLFGLSAGRAMPRRHSENRIFVEDRTTVPREWHTLTGSMRRTQETDRNPYSMRRRQNRALAHDPDYTRGNFRFRCACAKIQRLLQAIPKQRRTRYFGHPMYRRAFPIG